MRSDTSASGAQARAVALWVIVSAGLLYGVVNTFAEVVDLFGGGARSTAARWRVDPFPPAGGPGERPPADDYRPGCATAAARAGRAADPARRAPPPALPSSAGQAAAISAAARRASLPMSPMCAGRGR